MKKITDYEIMKEYFNKSEIFDNGILKRNSKMAGNIFAIIIRNNIKKILKDTNFDVSLNNSFIEGIRNEWDLIIFKKGASDNDVNIYNKNDVKCIIELKTASYFKSNDWKINKNNESSNKNNYKKDIKERFKTIETALQPLNNKCRYLYISLFQNSNHKVDNYLNEIISNMPFNRGKNSTFFFRVDTQYTSPLDVNNKEKNIEIKKFTKENDEEAFKNFILKNID